MRYQVYGWEEDEAEDYLTDYAMELGEALEKGYRDPIDYGTLLGSSEDEEEALAMTTMDYPISAVWDSKEMVWFN